MAANTATLLNGRGPAPPGDRNENILDLTGLNPYVAVTPAAPSTGGQLITPAMFGFAPTGRFDFVLVCGVTHDGLYSVQVFPNAPTTGKGWTSAVLKWTVISTGNEAGTIDLSASRIRLYARGV